MSFSAYSKKYNQLSHREKFLVYITATLLSLALFFLLLLEPSYLQMQKAKQQYATKTQIAQLNKQQSIDLRRSLTAAPEVALEEEITSLQYQYNDLKEALYSQQLTIISGASFSHFLKNILLSASSIQVDNIEVAAKPYAGDDELADTQDSVILKQSITLVIRGTDQDVKEYISYLETQNTALIWDSLQYDSLTSEETSIELAFHLYTAKE